MKTIAVYLNAQASGTNINYWESKLSETLFRYNTVIKKTKNLAELSAGLNTDIKNEVDLIIAVGGDGTVNNIIQKMVGENIKLFIIPTGTANDLASEMGINNNLKYVLNSLKNGEKKQIDLINVNGRYIATNGGIGLASEVAKTINDIRNKHSIFKKAMKLCKSQIYSIFVAQKLLSMNVKRYKVLIESPDLPYINEVINAPLVMINNQSTVAGNFLVAPQTKNNDGKFNVLIFKHKDNISLAKAILSLSRGNFPTDDKDLISFETHEVTINSVDKSNLSFFGDGESFEPSPIITAKIEPASLDIHCVSGKCPEPNSYSLDQVGYL